MMKYVSQGFLRIYLLLSWVFQIAVTKEGLLKHPRDQGDQGAVAQGKGLLFLNFLAASKVLWF